MPVRPRVVWKLTGAIAAAGAVLAFAASFTVPRRYVSSALMRVDGPRNGDLRPIQSETLSRSSLAEIITRPSLDLYRSERARLPLEDVIDQMRNDIRFQMTDAGMGISFVYPNREKAQAAASALSARFVEQNLVSNRWRAERWRDVWPQDSPPITKISVLAPAGFPESAVAPNRLAFAAAGLGAGLLLGLVVAFRHVAFFAGCGLVLGAAASYLVPAVYTSTAVMRFTPADVPERLVATIEPVPPRQRLVQMREQILSEAEDNVRSRIAISPVTPSAFRISFSAGDPETAQAQVRALVSRFVEHNISEIALAGKWAPQNEIRLAYQHKLGPNLEVLDPASLPRAPVSPDRLAFPGTGILLGIVAAIASRRRFSRAA